MARMEVDCNLKMLANFFKFFRCILEKSLKTDYSSVFRGKILIFSCRCCKSNFMLQTRLFVKYLRSFDQNTAKSGRDSAALISHLVFHSGRKKFKLLTLTLLVIPCAMCKLGFDSFQLEHDNVPSLRIQKIEIAAIPRNRQKRLHLPFHSNKFPIP